MSRKLAVIGVASSAGAYAPGQEKAPAELRRAGLVARLEAQGIVVDDLGDLAGMRWRPDRQNPRAMNSQAVIAAVKGTAGLVADAMRSNSSVLVLGGDCTVELGTVSGSIAVPGSTGLIYVDLDTDLNTPASTTDGALDWMGVAHLLALDGTCAPLAGAGARTPMLEPQDVLLFAHRNVTAFERAAIEAHRIQGIPADQVDADPLAAAALAVEWGRRFDRLLIHFDVDTIDFESLPLAENTRRKAGLPFGLAMIALRGLLQAPNWRGLTITEINPDHGAEDGSTVATFVDVLAASLGSAPVLVTPSCDSAVPA